MDAAATPFPRRLWGALWVVIPLAYNPVSPWQTEPNKAALLLVLAGLLAAWSLWRGALPRLAFSRAERWIASFLLVCLLATVLSIAPHWSLWGDPKWRNGLWIVAIGGLLFGLARRQLTSPERQEGAVTAILLGSAPVAVYGLFQAAGLDPFATPLPLGRVSSTLAYPNLLAGYLAMVVPLAASRLLTPGKRRLWVGMLLAYQVACLILTYGRAGWLATVAGLAVTGLLLLWASGRRRLACRIAVGLAAGLAILLALSLLPPLPSEVPPALDALTSMFRWTGSTAQTRLLGWGGGLAALRERPLLGYGPATLRVVLEWFAPPELARFGGASALGGRTHNAYLEVALESGLIGLGVYLAMLGALALPLWRAFQAGDPTTRSLQAGILGALSANLVNDLFSLDTVTTVLLFWALAGMAHARPGPQAVTTRRRPRLGLVVFIVTLLLASWLAVPDMLALAAQGQPPRESIPWLRLAGDLSPTPEVYRLALGEAYAAAARGEGDATLWARGADVLAALVRDRPDVAEYWRRYGGYLRRWHLAGGGDPIAFDALAAYARALALSPRDPDLWLDRGLMALQAGDAALALADFERANLLLGGYARYYGAMSIYALAQGDPEAAAQWQRQAVRAQRDWDERVLRR